MALLRGRLALGSVRLKTGLGLLLGFLGSFLSLLCLLLLCFIGGLGYFQVLHGLLHRAGGAARLAGTAAAGLTRAAIGVTVDVGEVVRLGSADRGRHSRKFGILLPHPPLVFDGGGRLHEQHGYYGEFIHLTDSH